MTAMYFDTLNSVYDEMFSIKQKKSTKMTKLPENKWKKSWHIPPIWLTRPPRYPGENSAGYEEFLAHFPANQFCNYDTECSNRHPSPSTSRPKGLSNSKMK